MIVWMPYTKPGASAQSLTVAHLNEQIAAAEGLLRLLREEDLDENHKEWLPTQMWVGFEYSLCIHGLMAANELATVRKKPGNMKSIAYLATIGKELEEMPGIDRGSPPWLGDLDVHRSHRSNLIMRHPKYTLQWKGVPSRMPVLWPQLVDGDDQGYRLRLSASSQTWLADGRYVLPKGLRFDQSRQEVVGA